MRSRFLLPFLLFPFLLLGGGILIGLLTRERAGGVAAAAATENGDVNGDGIFDVSDAVSLLNWLFLAGPPPAQIECPPVSPSALPATGQGECFDGNGLPIDCSEGGCAGQDGRYRAGCPGEGRFLEGEDGTVEDRCTGLVWQKEAASEVFTFCEALDYCEGLEAAGRDDWRLPSVRELSSLVDYGRVRLSIDPVFSARPTGYWTSTSQMEFPDSAWCVVFATGSSEAIGKQTTLAVRAVRGGR